MNKLPLSVFIIAVNEGDRIATAIESVRDWVDEVVVVDSGSTDNTVKLAEGLGARVLYNAWPGYGPQKRFAEDQCKNRWLMNLDADEEVTPELADEIQGLFGQSLPPLSAYRLRIRDLLPGEDELAPLAHTNFVLRLYDKEKARFSHSTVHDAVQVKEGETATLAEPVLHRSFRDISHALDKMNRYTSAQADNAFARDKDFPGWRLLVEFPFAFFKAYILRGYILRGRAGFVNAMIYAFTRFTRVAKTIEKFER